MTESRVLRASADVDERQYEAGLRPRTLDEYIGQERIRENLQVAITAAKQRGEALDHVLLYGPPGLGKTTLSTRPDSVPARSTSTSARIACATTCMSRSRPRAAVARHSITCCCTVRPGWGKRRLRT